jgi:hypothetical protein
MADEAYAPGLATLLQSVVEHSRLDAPEMTVILDRPLVPRTRRSLDESGVKLDFVYRSDLGFIPPKPHTHGRRRVTLQKLLVFNLPHPGRMAFVDSDMLCVGALDGLADMPPISAAINRSWGEPPLMHGRPIVNSGFFTFEADPGLASELAEHYRSSTTKYTLGDQMVLNDFLLTQRPELLNVVDGSWNTLTTRAVTDTTALGRARLLHYVYRKPWQNMWLPYPSGGSAWVDLYRLWWDHFGRSPMGRGTRRPPFWAIALANGAPARAGVSLARRGREAVVRRGSLLPS